MFQELLQKLLELPPLPVYATIAGLAGIENIFPPVPADTAVALGAFLSRSERISALLVFLVTWLSNAITATGVYLVARHPGRRILEGRVGRRLLAPATLGRIEALYQKHGLWGIFVSRFIPGLRAVVPPFAGIAGLSAPKALLPVYVASGIWYGLLTFLAATLVREADVILQFVTHLNVWAAGVGVAVMVAVIVIVILRRRRNER